MKLKDDEILDVILHEIAHALDFVRYGNWGHGKTWKQVCKEIGAKPSRLAHDISYHAPKKYKSHCEKCGKSTGKAHRRGNYIHRNCGGKVVFELNEIKERVRIG
jgi:predicted SprT family Zn-dependent metalloprotease